MNIKRLILLGTLLLTSCVSDVPGLYFETNLMSGPMDLKAEAYQFLDKCQQHGRLCKVYDLELEWVDTLDDDRVGYCELMWQGPLFKQKISILHSVEPWQVHYIMLHEMTHCTRFVDHHPGDIPHIMRSFTLNSEEVKLKTENEWEDQLFEWNEKFKNCLIGACK